MQAVEPVAPVAETFALVRVQLFPPPMRPLFPVFHPRKAQRRVPRKVPRRSCPPRKRRRDAAESRPENATRKFAYGCEIRHCKDERISSYSVLHAWFFFAPLYSLFG